MFMLENGREVLYQWDINQQIYIDSDSIKEVHFMNNLSTTALVCEVYLKDGKKVVDIPNILLQQPWDIKAFGYCGECVRYEKEYKVIQRVKPDDYYYTETEVKRYDNLVELLNTNYYDKATIDAKIPENMDMTNYYTKAEVDALIPPYGEEVEY